MKFNSIATQMAPCPAHGPTNYVFVSPKISHSVKSKKEIHESDILILNIESQEKIFEYYIDPDFLEEFVELKQKKVLLLKDRDKQKKELNDRLIIQKIIKQLLSACPRCMEDLLNKKD